jgi:hypothetical protein
MTTLEVIADADSTGDSLARALATVQDMCDTAMAVFSEMHQDWHRVSRQIIGQSLPWPAAEDVALVA